MEGYLEDLGRVRRNGIYLACIENQTEEICLEAVRKNGYALKYVKNQTNEICLEAVRKNGSALAYVENQTSEIALEAVKNDGHALNRVKNQTEEIVLEAVRQTGLALRHVKKQTSEIVLEAVVENKEAFIYVNELILNELINQGIVEYKVLDSTDKSREVKAYKFEDIWYFFLGCQKAISKEEFIHRIYNEGGGLEENSYRQNYLDFLNILEIN